MRPEQLGLQFDGTGTVGALGPEAWTESFGMDTDLGHSFSFRGGAASPASPTITAPGASKRGARAGRASTLVTLGAPGFHVRGAGRSGGQAGRSGFVCVCVLTDMGMGEN